MGKTSKWIRFYQSEDLVIDVPEEDFEITSACSIYEVPKNIRQAKEDAYTPKLISIGPFHYGKKNLAEMEKQKLRYLQKFCERTRYMDTTSEYLSFIKMQERRIRNCYSKSFLEADSSEFIKMILCDAIFILELFLRRFEKKDDFLLNRPWLHNDLQVDLLLLENQLPFFLLDGLYSRAPLPYACRRPFLELACNYFNTDLDPMAFKKEIKHFTDLKRWELVHDHPSSGSAYMSMEELCNATVLREGGIEFWPEPTRGLLDINFKKNKLHMPLLIVNSYNESHIRNVIALEQCHYPDEKAHVCAYIDLMRHLISTDKDVELLVKAEILNNGMGSAAAVVGLINNLLQGVEENSGCYGDIAQHLIKCHRNHLNRAIATLNRTKVNLKQVYFNNLLRGTSSVAALFVVLFTFTQTLMAILERVKPTK